eukprot:CAMPEP_0119109788 /NCGR_PEP_ID=MMETSP1180-20130426/23390_1 /TAXON_ID=3052 ORGANISM="Chlamydomonas cf sp, Strain CCMP681" /NCGR_SAMPLE_ID=MMETSP1180 /ASSEMBLY_ACC=CAM_ASM_000741 /LENGTH=574 /DNA_ID=CAMNT_0007095753 /DNA_START=105 /DNA_END=1829 /DNA_ORIENTATION=-
MPDKKRKAPMKASKEDAPKKVPAPKKAKPEPEWSAAASANAVTEAGLVNPKRMRVLKAGTITAGSPVVYWMSRDQRVEDNWALLYALEQAAKSHAPVAVVFNLVPAFLGAGARHWGFMLRGLRELAATCATKDIAFFMLKGDPAETLPKLMADTKAGLLVTDYSPLRIGKTWRKQVADKLSAPMHEVDAHNIVPCWEASDKRETAARTIRPKVHKALPEFLREFPATPSSPAAWAGVAGLLQPEPPAWDALLEEVLSRGAAVPEVTWLKPGEAAARAGLDGPGGFLNPDRLKRYADKRNDPNVQALSNLSPYLHYGQLGAQRAALEGAKHRSKFKDAVEGFLEELVVRRELADNFCEFVPDYDNISCGAQWAKDSLDVHRSDKRDFLYTRQQWEEGRTHDELWNAAQHEMVHLGKMHGFMRMYWAKKILEWSASPEEAIEVAIYLNDKYELDGRDPGGYVGVMWSMVGIHDMGWTERAVFGKIRYMNYAGCKRKFDIPAYVSYVNRSVLEEQARHRLTPAGVAAAAAATAAGSARGPVGAGAAAAAAPAAGSAARPVGKVTKAGASLKAKAPAK